MFVVGTIAFLDKTRSEYRAGRSITVEKEYEEKIKVAQDVAVLLRKNVIQAEKAPEPDVWSAFPYPFLCCTV